MRSINLRCMFLSLFSMIEHRCFGSVLSESMKAARDKNNIKRAREFYVLNFHKLNPYQSKHLAIGTKVKIVRGVDAHPIKKFKVLCSLKELNDKLQLDINMVYINALRAIRKHSAKALHAMLAMQIVPIEKIECNEKQAKNSFREACNYFKQQFKLTDQLDTDFASNIYVLEGMDYLFHASALEV